MGTMVMVLPALAWIIRSGLAAGGLPCGLAASTCKSSRNVMNGSFQRWLRCLRLRPLPQCGLQTRTGFFQAIGLHGFQHIVDRRVLECMQCVLIVGGHEHQQRERFGKVRPVFGKRLRDLESRHAGHANIEEKHVGLQRQRLFDRGLSVSHARDAMQVRP